MQNKSKINKASHHSQVKIPEQKFKKKKKEIYSWSYVYSPKALGLASAGLTNNTCYIVIYPVEFLKITMIQL